MLHIWSQYAFCTLMVQTSFWVAFLKESPAKASGWIGVKCEVCASGSCTQHLRPFTSPCFLWSQVLVLFPLTSYSLSHHMCERDDDSNLLFPHAVFTVCSALNLRPEELRFETEHVSVLSMYWWIFMCSSCVVGVNMTGIARNQSYDALRVKMQNVHMKGVLHRFTPECLEKRLRRRNITVR